MSVPDATSGFPRRRVSPGGAGVVHSRDPWPAWPCADLTQLAALVKTRLRLMKYRPGFLASTRLDL
jgi:hypothetical protein